MANVRKGYGENFDLLLFEEVDGVCPKCTTSLIVDKNGRKIKRFEKAHIYPLNPRSDEVSLLENEERLSIDVNAYENLLALCNGCHDIFDNGRTVEEYREMVAIKKALLRHGRSKRTWSEYPLEQDIANIIEELSVDDIVFEEDLALDPKQIDRKADGTLKPLTKRKIKRDVEYFKFIQEKLKAIDSIEPTRSELIAQQIKSYYIKLEGIYATQEEIYYEMAKWLSKKTKSSNEQASSIVISFFVQNCEVFR